MHVAVPNQGVDAVDHEPALVDAVHVLMDGEGDVAREEGDELLDAGVGGETGDGGRRVRGEGVGDAGEVELELVGYETGQELPQRHRRGGSSSCGRRGCFQVVRVRRVDGCRRCRCRCRSGTVSPGRLGRGRIQWGIEGGCGLDALDGEPVHGHADLRRRGNGDLAREQGVEVDLLRVPGHDRGVRRGLLLRHATARTVAVAVAVPVMVPLQACEGQLDGGRMERAG